MTRGIFSLVVLAALAVSPTLGGKTVSRSQVGKLPYRPQWVSVVKKGRLFKYKRKEFSSPRIREDLLFVGSDGGFFYAMKKRNGRKIWRFKTEGAVNSTPQFWESGERTIVLFGDDEGILYALAADRGVELWRRPLGSEILTMPAVSGNRIFVATADGKVAAIGAEGGEVLWEREYPQGSGMTIRGNAPPVVEEGTSTLYVGFADGMLRALAGADGRLLWERSVGGETKGFKDIDGALLVEGDRLFVATFEGGLFALSRKDGRILWTQPVGSGVPLLSQGETLFLSGSDGVLYAFHKKDGTRLWALPLGRGALTAPVFYKDMIAVGLSEKTMNFVRAEDGRILARRFARKGVFSDPVVDGDRIYYLSNGGRLYSLRLVR